MERKIVRIMLISRSTWWFRNSSDQCTKVSMSSEPFIVLGNKLSGWDVAKHPLSLTSIVEKYTGRSRNRVTSKMELYVARLLICFWKETKENNWYTCHSKKKFLLGHLKTFNVKTFRTLKTTRKQEIELTQPQASTSRNCAAELLKFPVIIRLDQQKCNASSHLKRTLFPIRCFHMVLLQGFVGKNVWDSYLRDSRRPQWK